MAKSYKKSYKSKSKSKSYKFKRSTKRSSKPKQTKKQQKRSKVRSIKKSSKTSKVSNTSKTRKTLKSRKSKGYKKFYVSALYTKKPSLRINKQKVELSNVYDKNLGGDAYMISAFVTANNEKDVRQVFKDKTFINFKTFKVVNN